MQVSAQGAISLLRALAGSRCQLCAVPLKPDCAQPLCPTCASLFPLREGGFCPLCGMCYADASAERYPCLRCRRLPPPWAHLAFHGLYAGALRDLIHEFKFRHDHGMGTLLYFLLSQVWGYHSLPRPDCLVPVPMTGRGLVRRGFNQSAELARMLGTLLDVPVRTDLLSKVRDTAPQSTLGRTERQENVRGAFVPGTGLTGHAVLLVDDVMTTGATLSACARACLRGGAVRVDVLVLARAM